MKKTILALSVIQTLLLVGCGGQPQGMPGQVMPGYANGENGSKNKEVRHATGGYGSTPGYANDPYATGNNGYTNTPNYGNTTGYTNGAYGAGNAGYGAPQIDPMTGQPIMVSNVSQDIVSKIQAAGGSGALKSDDAVRDALKSVSISQALGQSPLDHRVLIIKTLLDGYAGSEDRNYAKQVWATILPQDQQRLMSQDSELSKLVTDKLLKDSSGGISSILGSAAKLIGIGS